MALLALLAAVGGATAVPDARIAIDAVEVSSTDPVVGERTSLNVTLSNSGGSPAAADVTGVRVVDAGAGDDAEPLDEATAVGALSAGDSVDVTLWTRFDEPGERRLTVEVVAEQEATGGEEEPETVTVTRDVVVDVQPAEVALDLRTRGLSPADLQSEDEGQNAGGIDVGGIQGLFGGGGGGLDTAEDADEAVRAADAPVAVTVVNTGTTTADRVSLTAVGEPIAGGTTDGEDGAGIGDGGFEAGPYVVEDVAPGEERRVLVDLGPLDRRSDVTFTATFRSGLDSQAGAGAERTATSTLRYPAHDAAPTITDAEIATTEDGEVRIDANLGNSGSGSLEGVVVSVGEAPGVAPTPAGREYFVGAVGGGDFVAFDLRTAVNASVADEVPIRIAYTERGVRYVETDTVALRDATGTEGGGSGTVGTFGSLGVLGAVGLAGAAGLAVVGGVVRRRDV